MKQKKHIKSFGMFRTIAPALMATALTTLTAHAGPPPPHGISAGHVGVDQSGNGNNDVTVTNKLSINDFRIRPSANRGDFDIQIGEDFTDDVSKGVVISSIANHTRDNGDSQTLGADQLPIYTAGPHVGTIHFVAQPAGSYSLPIAYTHPNTISTAVVEFNMNFAAAWFPYDKYLGMYVGNSAAVNGDPNDTKYAGSAELNVGTHFIDDNANPLGDGTVNLTSLGINGNTDGVLLVTGAKTGGTGEDNYGLSRVNADGTWTLFSKDNGTDSTSYERDPLGFVYIPKTNQHLISGRFDGDGTILITSTNTPTADFTVTPLEAGRWELKVTGGSPRKGVLIISPEGGLTLNRDNIVNYEPNEARDGWIIESRDVAHNTLPPLENVGSEPVASFVYIPGATPGFVVTPLNELFTSEDVTIATFTVALETQPTADVVINLTSSNTAEGTVAPGSITFTTNDWNVAQTITVTGVDDGASDGPITYNIVLAAAVSDDTEYNGLNPADPTIVNNDNDGGIALNPTGGLTTTEAGGSATFTVRLTQAPTANVTIALSSSDTTEGAVSPESLLFTSENWNQDQTVTISGVDDGLDDETIAYSIITAAAVSADPFFNGRNAPNVSVENTDDDVVGVAVTPVTGLRVVESAGSASYNIVLRSQPASDVTITTESGDLTEGTVSPTTLTFNSSNWNVEQAVTITGVDDLIVDGNVTYFITNKLTTVDAQYLAVDPADVSVTTLDDEGVISVRDDLVYWGTGMSAISIASGSTIVDPNTPDYGNGTLRVALTSGSSAEDRLEIRDSGDITVTGNTVNFQGSAIGTFTGGAGATALVVSLNTGATPAATAELLRAVTFRTIAESPSLARRAITITVTDGGGGVSGAAVAVQVSALRVIDFQEGADSGYGVYAGVKDIELDETNPDLPQPTGRNNNGLYVDKGTAADGQALLRFDGIVGDGPNQIPTNSIIVGAELHLDINEGGLGATFHRMLVTWDPDTATWNTFGGGVPLDDASARVESDSQIGGATSVGATGTGRVFVGVTADVEAWVNGRATNYGWVFVGDEPPPAPAAPNSFSFSPSEASNVADRPRLRVFWLPKESATLASFRQGVNDYAGAHDTRILETFANRDTDYSSTARTFVDAVNTGATNNQGQILIRFNDIFGSEPGQIPPGAKIEAAVLDLASLGNDAPGDGAMFYSLLQGWPEVNTWNGWSDGIQTNGVEAAAAPSYVIGNASLAPDAQGGYFSFILTEDVQAWSSGARTNAGWALIPWPQGGNGWAVNLSETANEEDRPRLRVYYTAGAGPAEIEIDRPVRTATTLQFGFTGLASTAHSIYRSETVHGIFTKIGDATTGADGRGTFTDTAPPTGMAFYTVRSP